MLAVRDFYNAIDNIAPFSTAEPWDNVGLLAGSMDSPVTRALVALDATADVIAEAVSRKAELIVTHHPVIFSGLKVLERDGIPWLLARAGLSVISAHTNYDIAEGGVNDALAACLGFLVIRAAGSPPLCRAGELPVAMQPAEFSGYVRERLGAPGVRYMEGPRPVKTVAVCGGSGGGYLEAVVESGADAFVTGECKHHVWLEAARWGMTLVEAGHFHTENPAMAPLAKRLAELMRPAEVLLSGTCADGVKFA